jgi:GNAT superfamily N-acetyltransferase
MELRPRNADDVDDCVRLFRAVHQRDGYPIYLPEDLAGFVATGEELGAWVATESQGIVGHVALHARSWAGVMQAATRALHCEDGEIAVVARLVVAPSCRRAGIGRALLSEATDAARKHGRRPILDVAAHYHAATALYDTAGWRRIGTASFPLPDGTTVREIVFAAP